MNDTPASLLPPPTTEPFPQTVQGRNQRFTRDGSDELEHHLAAICEKIAAGLRGLLPQRRLQAVLLGGGYGRGEGGVLKTPEGDRPYNDLEFYVCLRGNRHLNERLYHHRLEIFGELLTPIAGVDVEFKIISLAELARRPIDMFSYDLVTGHRWLVGTEDMLSACAHHRIAEQIPLSEATRLMMNRCTGLLLARDRLAHSTLAPVDADFAHRNIAKAQLALGDVVLTVYGRYHWSCRKRHDRLVRLCPGEVLPWLDQVRKLHATGVEFKLHPERSSASHTALLAEHARTAALAQQVWLWLEERRLGVPFPTVNDYVESPLDKCPETARTCNVAVNFKARGWRRFDWTLLRHPRDRILRVLCQLLWEPTTVTSPRELERMREDLNTQATGFTGLLQAYRSLWQRVN